MGAMGSQKVTGRTCQEAAIKVEPEALREATGVYKEAPEGIDDGVA
jgi:hypothetical protein